MIALTLALAALSAMSIDDEPNGTWRAWLKSPGGPLGFQLRFDRSGDGLKATILNGEESLEVPTVRWDSPELTLEFDHYDSKIVAQSIGGRLKGEWTKVSGVEKSAHLKFEAEPGMDRFIGLPGTETGSPDQIAGRWEVDFGSSEDPAVAIFKSGPKDSVRGTFLTTTGDYRYLEGLILDHTLYLSCFDGAHAFLFTAQLPDDRIEAPGELNGSFWSRDSWHETWKARKNPEAKLPDAFTQVVWNQDVSLDDLEFPDLEGKARRLSDPTLLGKATILQVFGSWCPNCSDETKYLIELHSKYKDRGLKIIGVAFELTGNFDRDARQLETYVKHHRIPYPILLAGQADKEEATRVFKGLSRIKSYPTTVFLGPGGQVQRVHSGFSGPATGESHRELRREFEKQIETLLNPETIKD